MWQLSKYGSTWPNKWLDSCFQAFKLPIEVQLGAVGLVTPVLAKTQILKFYQPHMGKQKPKTSIIAQTSAKAAADSSVIRTNLFKNK